MVLLVVGVKMLLAESLKLVLGRHFNLYLLAVVVGILLSGVIASLIAERRELSRLPSR
jgi:predicted tellurium resistance membrane protein TerC